MVKIISIRVFFLDGNQFLLASSQKKQREENLESRLIKWACLINNQCNETQRSFAQLVVSLP